MVKEGEQGVILFQWRDFEQLLHASDDIKDSLDLLITQAELVLLHLYPGTMSSHDALEHLLHRLASDGHRIHEVARGAEGGVLPDAAIHILGDANLEAVAKQSEAVQVLLLRSQTIQLLLKRVSSGGLNGLGSSSLLDLLGDTVVLQNLLEMGYDFASSLALGCLSRDHEFLELVE